MSTHDDVAREDELIAVFCTVPDDETAERIARGLVEANLAACVKAIPGVRSFYSWRGALESDSEVQLLIKTRRTHFQALEAWIHEEHPYDVPEIVAVVAAHVGLPYERWTMEQTRS